MAGNDIKVIKATVGALPSIFKGSKFTRTLYVDLLAMLFEVLAKVRKEGLMSIENDVENPHESPIFGKYPAIAHDHHVMEFITDYLRMMVGGNLNALEIENLMDIEIETHHHEVEVPGQPAHPRQHLHRRDIQLRGFRTPGSDDRVDFIRHHPSDLSTSN